MPHTSQRTFFTAVTKTQTSDTEKFRPAGCLENKDLTKTSYPRKTLIPGCLENSDPQYFSNIATNYRPRAASLSLSHLQKRNFVLQKYRLKESSHWQNFDKTNFCWRFVMRPFVRIVTFDEVFKLRGQICWWSLNLFSSKSCQKNEIKINHAGI